MGTDFSIKVAVPAWVWVALCGAASVLVWIPFRSEMLVAMYGGVLRALLNVCLFATFAACMVWVLQFVASSTIGAAKTNKKADIQSELIMGVAQSIGLTLFAGYWTVLMVAGRAFAFISLATIVLIIAVILAIFKALSWTVGAVEALGISVLIGMAVDYCLHVGHAVHHNLGHGKNVHESIRASFGELGVEVMYGALTTAAAACCLIPCQLSVFTVMGVIFLSNTVVSLISTFFFFASLVCIVVTAPSTAKRQFYLPFKDHPPTPSDQGLSVTFKAKDHQNCHGIIHTVGNKGAEAETCSILTTGSSPSLHDQRLVSIHPASILYIHSNSKAMVYHRNLRFCRTVFCTFTHRELARSIFTWKCIVWPHGNSPLGLRSVDKTKKRRVVV
jgi:hypothetical protein